MNVEAIFDFFTRLGFRQALWLLPPAFALHVFEEAPQFTAWVNKYGSRSYRFGDFLRINEFGLLMTIVLCALVAVWPKPAVVFVFFALIVAQGLFFNPLFHAGATAVFGVYSPGLLTSLVINLPLFFYLSARIHREELLSAPASWIAFALAGIVHTVVVARTVFYFQPAGRIEFALPESSAAKHSPTI